MYEYKATVVSVTDGDTARLDIDLGFQVTLRNTPVRFIGINAPEVNTPEGVSARAYLRELLPVGIAVIVQTHKDREEKYGRILGAIYLPLSPSPLSARLNVNMEMVSKGHAVPYMVAR